MEQSKLQDQQLHFARYSLLDESADTGRLIGLFTMIAASLVALGFSIFFPHSYVREVNGPVAGSFVALLAGITWGAIHYAGTSVSSPDVRRKVAGIKTSMVFGLTTGVVVAVASYAYRGQTGGLQINGIEASLTMLGWFIFSAVVQKMKILLGNR